MPVALVTTLICALLTGIMPALWSALVVPLGQNLGIAPDNVRRWQRWHWLALALAFLIVGRLVDGWGGKHILFFGILGAAVALAVIGMTHSRRSALAGLLLLSLGGTAVTLPTLGLFLKVFPQLIPDLPAFAAMNLGFALVAFGTLLATPLAEKAVKKFGFRNGLQALAFSLLVPALLVAFTPHAHFDIGGRPGAGHLYTDSLHWWLLGALCLLYFPLESFIDCWKTGYLREPDHQSVAASWGFWIALIVSRLVFGWVVWEDYEAWGLVVLVIVYAVVVGNLAGAYAPAGGPLALWLVGGTLGPFLPTLLSLAATYFKDAPSTNLGAILGLGALSHFMLVPAVELCTTGRSAQLAMKFSLLMVMGWGCLALMLALA